MTDDEDRRKTTSGISPKRRIEDVKAAACAALKRFDKEAAELKLVFQECQLPPLARRA